MDEEKDLELQDSQPEQEDSGSQDTGQSGETAEEKIAKLEQANKELYARAKKAEEKSKVSKPVEVEKPPVPQLSNVDEIINAKFEERDLSSLEFPDEIKSEIRAYAKVKGISVREASKSEFIGFLKTKQEEVQREREASASTKGTGTTAKRDFSSLTDDAILNLSGEEFTQYKAWLKSQE